MNVYTIPTNDAFRALLAVLRLNSDKDYVISLFADKGVEITKSKLKSWTTPSNGPNRKAFRPMPRDMLELFIESLKEARLVDDPL